MMQSLPVVETWSHVIEGKPWMAQPPTGGRRYEFRFCKRVIEPFPAYRLATFAEGTRTAVNEYTEKTKIEITNNTPLVGSGVTSVPVTSSNGSYTSPDVKLESGAKVWLTVRE